MKEDASLQLKRTIYICSFVFKPTKTENQQRSEMSKFLTRFLFIALITTGLYSCSELIGDDRPSEGIIEYDVSYPKMDQGSILADLLPRKMTMMFKDNMYVTDLSAGFGMFKMSVLNHADDGEFAQMIKLIGDRYVVRYDEEAAMKSLENFPKVEIEETGKTKKIAEFDCKEAIVTVHGDSIETYTIYYTDQIRLDNANWFNHYAPINGVLMEYQVERYDLCTRFTATAVIQKELEDEAFEIPKDYEEITEAEMDEKMMEIFNDFGE